MQANTTNKELVTAFIEQVWNTGNCSEADLFLSEDFADYSLPPSLPPTAEGLKLWIAATGKSFNHHTVIEDMICEGNKVMARITMRLKHIGPWRDIESTGTELSTTGYRHFRIEAGKISGHWALIDGNTIENALRNARHGCGV